MGEFSLRQIEALFDRPFLLVADAPISFQYPPDEERVGRAPTVQIRITVHETVSVDADMAPFTLGARHHAIRNEIVTTWARERAIPAVARTIEHHLASVPDLKSFPWYLRTGYAASDSFKVVSDFDPATFMHTLRLPFRLSAPAVGMTRDWAVACSLHCDIRLERPDSEPPH